MPFDQESLTKARSQGYTDAQIYDHLSQSDERFRVAKQNGYSLDDVAAHLTKLKGGEQDNEDQIRNQPQADQEGNAQRVPDQQEPPLGSQANVQANVQLRTQDQGQRQRNDQANLTNEGQTKDAQGGIQGAQAGQGMEGQVPAGNQEEVATGSVQPAPEGNFFQRAYSKALANPKQAAEVAIGSVAQGAIEMAAGGKLSQLAAEYTPGPWYAKAAAGVGAFIGGQKLTDYLLRTADKYLSSDELKRAQADQPELAEMGQILAMAPQGVESLGNLGKAFSTTMTKEGATKAAKELAGKLAIGAGAGAAVGEVASGFKQDSKEAIENAIFGAILSGYHEGQIAKAGLPETAKVAAETKPDDVITKERAPKFEEAPAKPITLEPIIREELPLAQEEAAPSLPKEETQPPVSVAGEALAVEPIGEDDILSNSIVHTVRKNEDIPSIVKSGLRSGSNITVNPLEPNQSFGGQTATLVFDKPSVSFESKGYNPNDAIVTERKQLKPKAALIDTEAIKTLVSEPLNPEKLNNDIANLYKQLDEERKISQLDPTIKKNIYGRTAKESELERKIDEKNNQLQTAIDYLEKNPEAKEIPGFSEEQAIAELTKQIPNDVPVYTYDLSEKELPQNLKLIKPAEAPAEAQPTKPSETEIQETSGLPTLQRKPPVGEAEVKAEGGVAQGKREGKEEVAVPEGARVAAAAYLAPDGNTYEGSSHLDAMQKAKEAGAITQAEIDAKQTPESRNTEEFGFKVTLPDGTTQYTTREVAGNIAKQSGQALEETFVHGDKLHSNETRLDEYNHLGEERVSPQKFSQDPKAAVQEAIPEPTEEVLQKNQMTRPDAQALGITPKGTAQTNFLIDSVKSKVEELGDAIKYRGKNIKDLRKAGVEDEANQHASARIYVPVHVEELLGQVFGETKDIEKMRPTMDILVKDDIVGGYEDIVKQVNNLEAEKAQAQSEGRPTKAIQNKIDSLSQRGRDIEEAHPIEQYKQEIENASPEIQSNIERWKRHVVPEMDSLYNELKNVDPATEREGRGWKFGARLNLLSKTEEEKMASYGDLDKPMPSTSVSNYRNPNVKRDKFMQKASFLGDYSTDPVAILTNSLASRWNEVTKIRFYKALEDKGVGKIVAAGEEAPTMIGGKEAVRLPIKFPETDPKTGITRVAEQSLYVQKGLEDSVKKVLDVDSKPQQNPLAKAFTGIQIIGVADATAHLKNQQNIVRNSLGRDSAWHDLTAKIPFLGQAQSVAEISSVAKEVASNSQKIRDEKAYLAKIGALRPYYPSEGVQRFLGTHQLLHDVDTATRIILNRRYDNLIKRYGAINTESARRDFINQIGNYNRRLMGRWETLARDTGFSPFIVAGRAMNRYARKMITGDPGFQTDNVKGAIAARAAQISSLAFATLIPAITNMFTTGNPYGREGTPIGAIDFGPNYDTEEGKRRTFDVFALTGLRRGLRQFGIDSAIDGARSGKDIRDIERDMANEFITTKMHPWIGPAVGLGQETLTGKRFDLRTGYSQRYEARKIEGIGQYAENFRIALKQLNPLLYGVAGKGVEWAMKDVGGIPYPSEERASKENLGLISKVTGAPQVVGEIEGALEKPVMGAVGYKESPSEAIKLANSFGEAVQFTPEQDQRFTYRRQIKDALAKGDKNTARDLYQQGFNDGILTEADKKSIGRYIKYPEKIVQKVQMIKTADQAVRVFKVATPQEQDAVGEIVASKIANSTTLRPEQKQKLADTFFTSAKPNTEVYEIAKRRKKQ